MKRAVAVVATLLCFAIFVVSQASNDKGTEANKGARGTSEPSKADRELQRTRGPLPNETVIIQYPAKHKDTADQTNKEIEIQRQLAKFTKYLVWVGVFQFAALIGQAIVFFRQAGIMKQHKVSLEQLARAAADNADAASKNAEFSRLNAAATEQTATAAKVSADVSQKTLVLAGETAQKQLRAYVCVDSAVVKFPQPDVPEAQVSFKNCGQTPAYDFRGWIHTWFCEHPLKDALPPASNALRKGTEVLPPGRKSIFVANKKPPLPPQWLALLGTVKFTFYIYGEVYYRDAFGKEQWTKYRLIYGGLGGPPRKVPDKEEWLVGPDTEGNEAS